ncbi:MAG: fumarate hydratase [Candidatus Thermoplasmatota archaeon]
MMIDKRSIEKGIVELIRKAESTLPSDVEKALREAYVNERGLARLQLSTILRNIEVARQKGYPLCQDTGVQGFIVRVGECFPDIGMLKSCIVEGVRRATRIIPLRPNAVNPLTGEVSTDNTGWHTPSIMWDFIDGDDVIITSQPKGSGSENMSILRMLNPSVGLDGVKDIVIERVKEADGNPCPPIILGIGIGGGADLALRLGKIALVRRVGERNPDPIIADLELDLLKCVNDTGIGPMGLGGRTTALDVHVEIAHRHPASLPVGVVFQCWADRRASMIIHSNGEWEIV